MSWLCLRCLPGHSETQGTPEGHTRPGAWCKGAPCTLAGFLCVQLEGKLLPARSQRPFSPLHTTP